jgi:hypothetical protein
VDVFSHSQVTLSGLKAILSRAEANSVYKCVETERHARYNVLQPAKES